MRKYRIRLKALHDKTGLTAYAVAKRAGITETTTRKYVYSEEVISDTLPIAVTLLADFYGVDWRDVVETFEENEIKTPLAVPA